MKKFTFAMVAFMVMGSGSMVAQQHRGNDQQHSQGHGNSVVAPGMGNSGHSGKQDDRGRQDFSFGKGQPGKGGAGQGGFEHRGGGVPVHGSGSGHSHFNGRPAGSVQVSFGNMLYYFLNGIFYSQVGPERFEAVRPPIGMVVSSLYQAQVFSDRGRNYFISQGVVYEQISTFWGKRYRVVSYI